METDAFQKDAKKGSEIMRNLKASMKDEATAIEMLTRTAAGVTTSEVQRRLDASKAMYDKLRAVYKDNEKVMTAILKAETAERQRIVDEDVAYRKAAAEREKAAETGLEKDVSFMRLMKTGRMIGNVAKGIGSASEGIAAAASGDGEAAWRALQNIPVLGDVLTGLNSFVGALSGATAATAAFEKAQVEAKEIKDLNDLRFGRLREDQFSLSRMDMTDKEKARDDVRLWFESRMKEIDDVQNEYRLKANMSAVKSMEDDRKAATELRDRKLEEIDREPQRSTASTLDYFRQLTSMMHDMRLSSIKDVHERQLEMLKAQQDSELRDTKLTAAQRLLIVGRYAMQESGIRKAMAESVRQSELQNEMKAAAERERSIRELARRQENIQKTLLGEADSFISRYGSPEDRLELRRNAFEKMGASATQIAQFGAMDALQRRAQDLASPTRSGIGDAGITNRYMIDYSRNDNQRRDDLLKQVVAEIKELRREIIKQGDSPPIVDFKP